MSRCGSTYVRVTDVDRATAFYTEQVGFVCDVDHRAGDDVHVVRLPPARIGLLDQGSIRVGVGITDTEPGSAISMRRVVAGLAAARDELPGRVDVSEIRHMGGAGAGGSPDRIRREGADSTRSPTTASPTATLLVLLEARRDELST